MTCLFQVLSKTEIVLSVTLMELWEIPERPLNFLGNNSNDNDLRFLREVGGLQSSQNNKIKSFAGKNTSPQLRPVKALVIPVNIQTMTLNPV